MNKVFDCAKTRFNCVYCFESMNKAHISVMFSSVSSYTNNNNDFTETKYRFRKNNWLSAGKIVHYTVGR